VCSSLTYIYIPTISQKNISVPTSEKTRSVSITKTLRFMLFEWNIPCELMKFTHTGQTCSYGEAYVLYLGLGGGVQGSKVDRDIKCPYISLCFFFISPCKVNAGTRPSSISILCYCRSFHLHCSYIIVPFRLQTQHNLFTPHYTSI